jgi:hypothetical protein
MEFSYIEYVAVRNWRPVPHWKLDRSHLALQFEARRGYALPRVTELSSVKYTDDIIRMLIILAFRYMLISSASLLWCPLRRLQDVKYMPSYMIAEL